MRIFKIVQPFILPLIILLGLGLRLFQLGRDSFWLDEAGVAVGAQAPALGQALAVARTHVMAMPLDYVVDWVVARVCTSEGCLRFPAVVWGTLTLITSYTLFRRLGGKNLALVAVTFLALSIFHIRYSQEARFYASMLFFYVLTTNILLDTLENPTWFRWLGYVIVTLIGIYFHVFVVLNLANGFFWLLINPTLNKGRRPWLSFFASALVIVLAIIPGYFLFSYHVIAKNAFLMNSITDNILELRQILVWIPLYQLSGISPIWYGLNAALVVIGVYWAVRKPRRPVLAILISLIFQAVFIAITDQLWNYFLEDKQLLFVLPMVCFLSALGLFFIFGKQIEYASTAKADVSKQSTLIKWPALILGTLIVGLLIISYVPAISDYYLYKRSYGREISQKIIETWTAGKPIYVIPSYNAILFKYYLDRAGREDISSALKGSQPEDILPDTRASSEDYFITPVFPKNVQNWMTQLGYSLILPITDDYIFNSQFLWSRGQ